MSDPNNVGLFKLQRGYKEIPEEPRIEARTNGTLLASAPLQPLPRPVRAPLVAKVDPRIDVVERGDPFVEVESRTPLARNERWHVEARRTAFARLSNVAADLPRLTRRWPTDRLSIPYAEGADEIDLDVTRFEMVKRSVVIRIPGLRVVPRLGGTALVVDRAFSVPTGLGLTLDVLKQDTGPRRPVQHGNPRTAVVNLVLRWYPDALGDMDARARSRRGYVADLDLLSPSAESLGLRELRVGGGISHARHDPISPLQPRTFTAVVRLTLVEPKLVGRFRTTVPITHRDPDDATPLVRLKTALDGRPAGILGWAAQ